MIKDGRNKTLAKNTVLLSIGQFVPKLISMFTLPILTTWLTKTEYGIYDLANSMVSLIVPLTTLQIQQVAFRYLVLAKERREKIEYFTSAFLFLVLSSLICIPVILGILHFTTSYSVLDNVLICVFLISESFYRLAGQLIRGLGYNLKYSIGAIVFSIAQLVAAVVFVVWLKYGVFGVFLSFTISYIIAILYMFASAGVWQYISIREFSLSKLKEMLSLSVPIVPSSISLWIVNLSDRLVITSAIGIEANAIYGVANKIPNLFSMAYTTFNLAWTESATLAVGDKDTEAYYSDMIDKLVCFLTGIMLLLISTTPAIFGLLINSQYDSAYYQIPILFFGVFLNSVVQFYGAIYVAIKRTRQVGFSSAAGAILNLTINLLLVKRFGLFAASVSTALAYLIVCVYRVIDISTVLKIRYNIKHMLQALLIILISAIICFHRNNFCNAVNVIIAIIYNVIFNGEMIKRCSMRFKKKSNKG